MDEVPGEIPQIQVHSKSSTQGKRDLASLVGTCTNTVKMALQLLSA